MNPILAVYLSSVAFNLLFSFLWLLPQQIENKSITHHEDFWCFLFASSIMSAFSFVGTCFLITIARD